jgi:predicted KAP-like P-loop ATPase
MSDTASFPLISDEPSKVDLLAFGAVAKTVADALFDPALDPVALGLAGSWGSGKTTVLNLVEEELKARSSTEATVLVVRTEPWRYDPTTGPKETLISEVLAALEGEFKDNQGKGKAVLEKLKTLATRVNWARAMKTAAKASITLQLPTVEDLLSLVRDDKDDITATRGLGQFRDEFAELLGSKGLESIHQVAVLVDDLDRCLPETVVETLEAIRLFLAVQKMSFVIAADERRVAEAIRQHLHVDDKAESGEGYSTLYLHKIVQTTIPVPALSRFDTESYLFLLMAQPHVDATMFSNLVARLDRGRFEPTGLASLVSEQNLALPEQLVMAE